VRTLLFYLVLVAIAPANGQQVGQNKPADAQENYTISTKVQLVVESVVVRDKQGKLINGLTAKDFVIAEDGVPQKIRFCEHQDLSANASLLPALTSGEKVGIYEKLMHTQILPETVDKERYKDRRLLALYFDLSAMGPSEQARALAAAQKFVRTQMSSADLVSIMRYSTGSVDVLQDFTADRGKLLSILETMLVGEGRNYAEAADDTGSADMGAAFGQDDGEFNIFNTDRQLAALQTAVQMLGQVNEKKSLIYFAGGLRLNGIDNQAQLHATVDAAIRAGVTLWPIDTRGLVADAPLGDATQASQGSAEMYTGRAAMTMTGNFQGSQDTLYALAGDTGGRALLDSNDLDRGIVQAQQAISDYYVIGYYTTNAERNGKFRRVHVSVPEDAEAKLEYRQGYYAEKEFGHFTAADKERQLEEALLLEDPITELSIALEIDHFQLNRAEYFVPIVVKIPGRELALAKRRGAQRTLIDFIGEIKDGVSGRTLTNVRDSVDIRLSDATAAELAHRPIEYDIGFTLLPGKYRFKFLARDDETGRIGTYETTFTIPNLNREQARVPISSVVLSSQRVELKEAIYNAANAKDRAREDTVNPLVHDGRKLVPSVTRVFDAHKQMFVYLQAYRSADPGAPANTQPFVAYVSLYSARAKAFETPLISVTPSAATHLGVASLNFGFSVKDLAAGAYDCQVTVLDPATSKAAFWRAPIVISSR